MATMILDKQLEAHLLAERRASGADRFDEVWEDVYMMAPMPNHEHQVLIGLWTRALCEVVTDAGLGDVVPGVNVSDRTDGWERNYRVPDVAVFLKTTQAVNHNAFWFGGPDFALEIISPGDRTREKLAFYGSVGTRELLILDRSPWQLELYRNSESGQMLLAGATCPEQNSSLTSTVLPLRIRWQLEQPRPRMIIEQMQTKKTWMA